MFKKNVHEARSMLALVFAILITLTALFFNVSLSAAHTEKAILLKQQIAATEAPNAAELTDIVEASEQAVNSRSTVLLVLLLIILLLCVFFILMQKTWLFAPIKKMQATTARLADGDVDVEFHLSGAGEFARLNKELVRLTDNLKDLADSMNSVARYDLTVEVSPHSDKDYMSHTLLNMIESNKETLSEINTAAEQLSGASQTMLKSGESFSKSAMFQASAIEEITATVTQIAIQSKQISENSALAKNLSDDIIQHAVEGNRNMGDMLSSMEDISQAADNISHIIKAIDEIAFKTNILALNAAVEAGRAGKDGRGFAVVANEVRNLAGRSAKAAKETEQLINDAIESVSGGREIAAETAKSLSKILESVNRSAPLIESISVATNEQYIGIEQANQAIEQVANTTERNAKYAEETAMASQQLSSQAEVLKHMVHKYKISDEESLVVSPSSENSFAASADEKIVISLED